MGPEELDDFTTAIQEAMDHPESGGREYLRIHKGNCKYYSGKCTCAPFQIPLREARILGARNIAERLVGFVDVE